MKITEITSFTSWAFEAVRVLTGQVAAGAVVSEVGFREIVEDESVHLFFLEDDGRVAGMLSVATYPTLSSGLKAWIEDVVVDEASRGKGYGKALTMYAIGFAREAGVESLSLTSAPWREAANGLYRSLGFVQYETNVYRMKFI